MKRSILRHKYALWLVAALTFAACSQDELADDNRLPEGKYPLLLSASVAEAVQTRTAGKDSWNGNEEIAVSVNDGTSNNTYKYKITDAGGSTVFTDTKEPFYWQSTTQTATVTAWYPYADLTGIDITRQDEMDDLSEIDFLKADPVVNANYQTDIILTFRHQMAKVCYTLVPGDNITVDDLTDEKTEVSIFGYTQANFSKGTTEGTDEGWITPTSDHEALLVPQDMTDKPFIKVSISGNDFIYTPGAGAANLLPGTRYTYIITVKADAIDVTVDVTGSDAWANSGSSETVGSKTVLVRYTAADVKKGDYIYTDGTTSDGGLRTIYTDGSMVTLSGAEKPQPVAGKTVAGIVFWTPSETSTSGRTTPANLTDDRIMAADYPDCTHGLAVSLKDVSTSMAWQSSSESVATYFQSSYFFTHPDKNNFVSIASSVGNTDNINKILGYQNTQVLLYYNVHCNGNSKPNYIANPVAALAEFGQNTNPAPTGSTGWFFPSLKELHILFFKDADNVYFTGGIQTRDIVNASLSAVGGDNLDDWDVYWSSSEYANDSKYAFCVDSYNGSVRNSLSKNGQYRVRAVCAF